MDLPSIIYLLVLSVLQQDYNIVRSEALPYWLLTLICMYCLCSSVSASRLTIVGTLLSKPGLSLLLCLCSTLVGTVHWPLMAHFSWHFRHLHWPVVAPLSLKHSLHLSACFCRKFLIHSAPQNIVANTARQHDWGHWLDTALLALSLFHC